MDQVCVCVCRVAIYCISSSTYSSRYIYSISSYTYSISRYTYSSGAPPSSRYAERPLRQHTSAYVRIRQHTSAYAVKQVCRASTVYGPLCVCVCTYIHTRYLAIHTPVAYHRYAERPLFMDQVLFIFCLCGNLGGAPVG